MIANQKRAISKFDWVVVSILLFDLLYLVILIKFPYFDTTGRIWRTALGLLLNLAVICASVKAARVCAYQREKRAWYWLAAAMILTTPDLLLWVWKTKLATNQLWLLLDVTFVLLFVVSAQNFRAKLPHRKGVLRFLTELSLSLSMVLLLNAVFIYEAGSVPLRLSNLFNLSSPLAILLPLGSFMAAFSISQPSPRLPRPIGSALQAGFGISVGMGLTYSTMLIRQNFAAAPEMDGLSTVAYSLLCWAAIKRSQFDHQGPSKGQLLEVEPYRMVRLWGLILISFAVGSEPFWSELPTISRFLLLSLLLISLIAAIRSDLLISNEREVRRELLDTLRMRDEFIDLAAHELRTPLTPLKGVLFLLKNLPQEKDPGDTSRPQLQKLVGTAQQVERLGFLAEDMIEMTEIDSGRPDLNRGPVDLSELVRKVIEEYSKIFQIKLPELSIIEEAPVCGNWDRARIAKVIRHLISNAEKFGEHKPIEVRVCQVSQFGRLTVRDSGPGISTEMQKYIFSKNKRTTPVLERGGLGLGLFIASQIVQQHGGNIRVESELGKGALFIVDLPLS